jgi:hypothetical protein
MDTDVGQVKMIFVQVLRLAERCGLREEANLSEGLSSNLCLSVSICG